MATKPATKTPTTKTAKAVPVKAVAKPEVKKAPAAAKPASKKAVVKVFEGDVKVKKVKPTITTETIITTAHSQVSKIFS